MLSLESAVLAINSENGIRSSHVGPGGQKDPETNVVGSIIVKGRAGSLKSGRPAQPKPREALTLRRVDTTQHGTGMLVFPQSRPTQQLTVCSLR